MGKTARELIDCHDCGNAVSFSATTCPHCGSREPAGSYRMSAGERYLLNIERRNDRDGAIVAGTAGAIGALYGAASSASLLGAIGWAIVYGAAGLMVGIPVAFAVNITRRLVR
jgi:hypothetical protein